MKRYIKHLKQWIGNFPNPFDLHTWTGVLGEEALWCLGCDAKSTRKEQGWEEDSKELLEKYKNL